MLLSGVSERTTLGTLPARFARLDCRSRQRPSKEASPRLLALCEALLEDRTIALLSLPFSYGEIRWLAADAVASLRRVLNISVPVVIPDVFGPVSGAKAEELLKAAGLESKGGIDGVIEALESLAKMDRLPRRKITRTP